ncbi:MAG: dephospho-CoA kinase [Alphaproteobacteria bacterium]|nr:dephospho-CoA kinase [Alphaproteobacteria bacterium]
MRLIGLTGSIAMGKSTAARLLRRRGLFVHDADAAVHRLLARGGSAVAAVEAAFPGIAKDGAVDRRALGARVFGDAAALARLEAILHPLVRHDTRAFCARHARRRARAVVLDIPLLYETRAETHLDAVVVVTAPAWLQRARVLRRPGMTVAALAAILARQTPDREKRRRADALASSALGIGRTWRDLARGLRRLERTGAGAWRPGWR